MAQVQLRADEYIPGAKWFRIEGDSREEVQQAVSAVINWIGLLPGHNSAEFKHPERFGQKFVSSGYTLIDEKNSYDSLRFD